MKIYLKSTAFPIYAILISIGAIISLIMLYFRYGYNRKIKVKYYLYFIYLYLIPGIVLFIMGAYLLDNFFHYLNGEEFGSSGFSFLGGCLPLMVVFLFHFSIFKNNKTKIEIMNSIILFIPFIHAFGRIGCFFSGCCFGIHSSWGVVYWEGSLASNLYGINEAVLPTQLIESLFLFVLFFILLLKIKDNRFFYYTLIYGIYRFIFEFLRGDNRGSTLLFVSPSQLMSLVFMVLSIVYYLKFMKKKMIQNNGSNCNL